VIVCTCQGEILLYLPLPLLLYSNMNRPASKCVDVFVCSCDVILRQLTSRGSLLDRSLRAAMVTRQARVEGLDSATHRLNQQLGPSWQLGDRLGQALTRYSRASCCNFIDSVEHSPSGKLARHQPLGSRSTTRHNHAIRRSTRGLGAYPLDQYDLTRGSRSTSSTL
jgi:hypothetical protein